MQMTSRNYEGRLGGRVARRSSLQNGPLNITLVTISVFDRSGAQRQRARDAAKG